MRMMRPLTHLLNPRNSARYLMLAIMATAMTALTACGGEAATPTPSAPLTETQFRALLSAEDVQEAIGTSKTLTTRFFNYKELAQEVAPQQVANMDSFFGRGFETEAGASGITLTIIDFDTVASMTAHFTEVQSQSGAEAMSIEFGDGAYGIGSSGAGVSVLTFAKGDRMVQLFSSAPPGEEVLTDLDGLIALARVVDSRL